MLDPPKRKKTPLKKEIDRKGIERINRIDGKEKIERRMEKVKKKKGFLLR